jgi:tetratricopeptide (TPR) repeat protein
LGISSMHLHGKGEAPRTALKRSVAIAEQRSDALNQIGLLGLLRMLHFRRGDFKTALHYAKRSRAVAETVDDPAAIALAHSMLGRSLHVAGDLKAARVELEASLQHWSRAQRSTIYLAHELHYTSDLTLARTLWLQGYPAQAAERAHRAIKSARHLDHPASLVVALAWGASVFLWTGDFASAEEYIDATIYQAESNSIRPFIAVGRARKAELAIRRGDAKHGVESLQACLEAIHSVGSELLTTEFDMSLLQGVAALGQFAEGITLVDRAIGRVETNGDDLYMPELLRLKAGILLAVPQPGVDDPETCLMQSLALSRRQGARAWELRTATDLAALLAGQGRPEGRALLQPVFEQFVEGPDTADLRAASDLLSTLA